MNSDHSILKLSTEAIPIKIPNNISNNISMNLEDTTRRQRKNDITTNLHILFAPKWRKVISQIFPYLRKNYCFGIVDLFIFNTFNSY